MAHLNSALCDAPADATSKPRRKGSPGSHGRLDKPRPEGDFYRSPPNAISLLLDPRDMGDMLDLPRLTDGLILDAGAGDGRLTRPLLAAGYQVIGVELHDRNHDAALPITTGVDFLGLSDSLGATTIVANPPYNLADAFIRHGLHLLPEGGELHALLRHNWMCGIRRRDLLPLLRRIVLCRRLRMLPADREHDDKGHDATTDFSWFTFTKGRTEGRPEIIHADTSRR